MELAFRTNIETIEDLRNDVPNTESATLNSTRKSFKKIIRPLIKPAGGILNGSTIKDTYFPSTTLEGNNYDFFISHSHNNEEYAILLANWLERNYGCSCFVDSMIWKSADELLKAIDDIYCYKKHTKTYDYKKRNFTTSHVHAILSMALLDTIKNSQYCIFIESEESISLENGLRKRTFSPWLYEEIKYMALFQPYNKTKNFAKADSLNEGLKMKYDAKELEKFPFLDVTRIRNLSTIIDL